MCGLIGIATQNFGKKEYRAIASGLYLSEKRGVKGTGVGVVCNNLITTIKSGGRALDFIESRQFQGLKRLKGKTILMGHTRQPIYGGQGKRVSHPFRVNHTLLCHNGLLVNFRELTKKYSLHPVTENDTEVLTLMLDKFGLKKMNEWAGTFALSFYYKKRLYLYKDSGGELCLGVVKAKEKGQEPTFFWASEWDTLSFIFNTFEYDGVIYPMKAGVLWSCSLEDYPNCQIQQAVTTMQYYVVRDFEADKGNKVRIWNEERDRQVWGEETDGDTEDLHTADLTKKAIDINNLSKYRCEWCGSYSTTTEFSEYYNSWMCEKCRDIAYREENYEKNLNKQLDFEAKAKKEGV